jgi:hypothetical protein
LVAPSAVGKTTMLLKRVKVVARTEQVPSAEQIRATSDQKFFDQLTRDEETESAVSDRQKALAERLAARDDSARTISRLLAMARFAGPTEPREIRRVDRGPVGKPSPRDRDRDREPRAPMARASHRDRPEYPARDRGDAPRDRPDVGRSSTPYRGAQRDGGDWVSFRITWGGEHGADARKLLAMACRWGEIRGSDVGAIEIERDYSRLSVKASVARGFAEATSKPDSRNPRVTIQADDQGIAPHTLPPPPPRAPHAPAAPRHAERASRPAERAPYKGPAERARPSAPRETLAPREPHAPREAAAPRERPAPREAAPAPGPRSGFGFPRNPSRPRVATGYPHDAKKKQHSAARSHTGPRDAARPHTAPRAADTAPARDGGQPPRRRRVVTR